MLCLNISDYESENISVISCISICFIFQNCIHFSLHNFILFLKNFNNIFIKNALFFIETLFIVLINKLQEIKMKRLIIAISLLVFETAINISAMQDMSLTSVNPGSISIDLRSADLSNVAVGQHEITIIDLRNQQFADLRKYMLNNLKTLQTNIGRKKSRGISGQRFTYQDFPVSCDALIKNIPTMANLLDVFKNIGDSVLLLQSSIEPCYKNKINGIKYLIDKCKEAIDDNTCISTQLDTPVFIKTYDSYYPYSLPIYDLMTLLMCVDMLDFQKKVNEIKLRNPQHTDDCMRTRSAKGIFDHLSFDFRHNSIINAIAWKAKCSPETLIRAYPDLITNALKFHLCELEQMMDESREKTLAISEIQCLLRIIDAASVDNSLMKRMMDNFFIAQPYAQTTRENKLLYAYSLCGYFNSEENISGLLYFLASKGFMDTKNTRVLENCSFLTISNFIKIYNEGASEVLGFKFSHRYLRVLHECKNIDFLNEGCRIMNPENIVAQLFRKKKKGLIIKRVTENIIAMIADIKRLNLGNIITNLEFFSNDMDLFLETVNEYDKLDKKVRPIKLRLIDSYQVIENKRKLLEILDEYYGADKEKRHAILSIVNGNQSFDDKCKSFALYKLIKSRLYANRGLSYAQQGVPFLQSDYYFDEYNF